MAAAWLSSNLDALDLGMIAMVYYVLAATVIIGEHSHCICLTVNMPLCYNSISVAVSMLV